MSDLGSFSALSRSSFYLIILSDLGCLDLLLRGPVCLVTFTLSEAGDLMYKAVWQPLFIGGKGLNVQT